MKKNIITALFFTTMHCTFSQVDTKLAAYTSEVSYNKQQQINFISFNSSKVVKEAEVAEFINNLILGNGATKVAVLKNEKDTFGFSHTKYALAQNGVLLHNKVIAAHCKNGELNTLNGDLYINSKPSNKFSLTEKSALKFALKKVNAKSYKWENKAEEAHMREVLNDPSFTYYPFGTKVIYDKEGKTYNAYKFNIYADAPLYRANVIVDAATGKILVEETLICNIDVPGTAVTKYSGTQTITCDQTGGVHRLKEVQRGLGVETYNMNTFTVYASATNFTNASANWTAINNDQGARDAHWGAEKTYDYFMAQHNRNSVNNAGQKLLSYVHYGTNYQNAFWDGLRMVYGDGNGTSMRIFSALDVCGHEVTHGVTGNSAGLIYSNESGALNEAFSDIFGTAIENYGRPGNWNWKIGEDITSNNSGLRNMSNPNPYQNPDTYLGTWWYTGPGDNGGVHYNSGVANFWFYLLTTGGNGTNDIGNAYTVSALGMTTAARIAYRALTVYFTPTTNYAEARLLSIQAAKDLYGICSNEVQQTARAWYAVGVGPNYSTNIIAPNFQSAFSNFCSLPASVNFINTTSNGQTYTWNFGDGSTTNATNPTHVYSSSGIFNVKLKATGCSNLIDSITKIAYVVIDVPPSPVSSGVISCGNGPVTLTATASGTLNWYLSPFSLPFSSGPTFLTPNLSSSTTFYASNVVANAPMTGGMTSTWGSGGSTITAPTRFLRFDVSRNSVLNSVSVFVQITGSRTIQMRNSSGIVLYSTVFNFTNTGQTTVPLNYALTAGTDYQLGFSSSSLGGVYRSTIGVSFPYNVANCVNIKGSSTIASEYFWFYNWSVTQEDCVSPLTAVTASVLPAVLVSASAPNTNLCQGNAAVPLTGSPSGGSFSGQNVSGSSFDPLTIGNFNVVYTYLDLSGCTVTTDINMIVNACTGLNTITGNNTGISIYPNPVNDHLTISNNFGTAFVSVTDASGRIVLMHKIMQGEEIIQLGDLLKGLYLINVTDEPGKLIKTARLIKN